MELLDLDILMEILSRLSVKDLIRLKSVSKTFLDLISNDDFIRLHLNKSSLRAIYINRYAYLFLKQHGESSLRTIYIDRYIYFDYWKQYRGAEVEGMGTLCYASSYGTCNGLVCLLPDYKRNKYAEGALLWNPALHEAEFVPIRRPRKIILNSWFGYDNDEYKLILGTTSHYHLIRLYVDTDTWKSSFKFNKNYGYYQSRGTLVHRTVHWPSYNDRNYKHMIISYDLRNETVGRIEIPDGVDKFSPFTLGQVDGCLSTMFTEPNHTELWVMKKYGVEESWTKLMIIPRETFPTYRYCKSLHFVVEFDDPAQLSSPIYGLNFFVESLISPRTIKTKMC